MFVIFQHSLVNCIVKLYELIPYVSKDSVRFDNLITPSYVQFKFVFIFKRRSPQYTFQTCFILLQNIKLMLLCHCTGNFQIFSGTLKRKKYCIMIIKSVIYKSDDNLL